MNKNHPLEYHDLARIQIDTAIELYEVNNFVSALTLAGAGEDITGKLLIRIEKKPILHELQESIGQKTDASAKDIADSLNLIRNGFKHMVEAICELDIDVELQARILIMRAVSNYCLLQNQKTDAMDRFLDIFEKCTTNA